LILCASENLERGTWLYWQFEHFVRDYHCQAFLSQISLNHLVSW